MVSSVASSKKMFKKLCGPAKFYLVLSLISLSFYLIQMVESKNKMNTLMGLSIQSLVVLVWTYILNWVCSLKYGNKIAWFLVFLPLLLLITMMILMYHMIDTLGLTKDDIYKIINQQNGGHALVHNKDDIVEGNCSSCSI
tara:strand:- start:3905 stop:4324 length:420 start_codon:yes stop_codon:yes gene_type:complete